MTTDTPPTPGQRAYEAYWPGLAQHSPYLVSDPPVAWDALPTVVQRAWEAAAQAVLRQAQGTLTVDLDPDILREEDRHA